LEILNEQKIWCGPVNSFEEVFDNPQVAHNEIMVTMQLPKAGEVKLIGFPAKFDKTPATYRTAAPLVGEHNEEILQSLGYDKEEISRLEREGVTGRGEKAEVTRGE
jgi:crotonobetainyl-CoA:carnitine CoA-transferase CaiB-like acyl-CoA transferase